MKSQEGKKGWLWGVKQRNRKKTKCAAARCGALEEEAEDRAEQHRITRQNTQCNRKKNEDEITLEIA